IGLWFEYEAPIGYVEPPAGNPRLRQVTRVYLAEVPPPYAGSTMSARGKLYDTSGSGNYVFRAVTPAASNPPQDAAEMGILGSLVDDGDGFLARFDYKGEWYRFVRNGAQLQWVPPNPMPGNFVRPPGFGNNLAPGKPFQILRSARRVGNPLELPAGTCVDIEYGGMGPTGFDVLTEPNPNIDHGFGFGNNRLVLMFNPSGSVDSVYVDSAALTVTGTVHFLLGKIDKVNMPPAVGSAYTIDNSNLADPNSVWVSVGRLNGSVTTSENMPDVEHGISHPSPWSPAGQLEYLEECRQVATGREQMAGK
ncbi:MAG: hypothetical protein WD872_13820, partial [Pirellulaceae bacterium]